MILNVCTVFGTYTQEEKEHKQNASHNFINLILYTTYDKTKIILG